MNLFGIKIIKDENATCDKDGKYTYINVFSGNSSRIEQTDNTSCYNLYINNCEIIQVLERFMIENFVEASSGKIVKGN